MVQTHSVLAALPRDRFFKLNQKAYDMTLFHAVVWTDHQSAQVLQFDAEHVVAEKLHAHTHHTAQHGSSVRSEHEFFAEVCAALDDIAEVLVTGSHTALADFRSSLAALGAPTSFVAIGTPRLRGGFVNRNYRIVAGGRTLRLITYAEPGARGRWEQYIVMPQ